MMQRVVFTTIIFIACCNLIKAQPYTNLVLEGAGVRGIAYVGAIKVLEGANVLSKIDKVAGTSAGAIAAMALALGYSSKDIEAFNL